MTPGRASHVPQNRGRNILRHLLLRRSLRTHLPFHFSHPRHPRSRRLPQSYLVLCTSTPAVVCHSQSLALWSLRVCLFAPSRTCWRRCSGTSCPRLRSWRADGTASPQKLHSAHGRRGRGKTRRRQTARRRRSRMWTSSQCHQRGPTSAPATAPASRSQHRRRHRYRHQRPHPAMPILTTTMPMQLQMLATARPRSIGHRRLSITG